MARIEGKAGRYVGQELSKKLKRALLTAYISSMVLAAFIGVTLAHGTWPVAAGLLIFEVVLFVLGRRFVGKAENEIANWKRGLDGEIIVGRKLAEDLPDNFCVIHDLNTQFGNLDHVVIGPTGVFAVETKNWRGTVTSDGKGELLLNGKPTDKPCVKNFTRTIMTIRERLVPLAQTDHFIQGVMVFPSAHEDAKWGTTGSVHCIGGDRIPDYFLKSRERKVLSPQEVDELARGLLALARMDSGFEADKGVVEE